ncbi:uncharacterized protein MELLADRAFT_87327 [Melampsora larici-populina 98AG31]|uniref:Uncharacterized protein n=1 Tax=Melampsora larici-populina (strain 98AG31 / pathotype 3-4-7) TaxID=747676 RepID=F4RMV0_MELLP|nr:uncharacterized protein MELLADRAFT_87327 [Melampsora larici-populina 98AG31]EGG06175.1 hypothetical protein MELLADRAFT_87327 [Melampsora larici-populina 98AG31]
MVFPVGHQGFEVPIPAVEEHHHGVSNVVHRDPTFGGQALGRQGSIVIASNRHVDVDLTALPSPAPQVTQSSESPVVAIPEFKPTQTKMAFHVYIADNLTDAQKQSGIPVTYSDYLTKLAFDILINIHGRSLLELKRSIFMACNKNQSGCGTLLSDADAERRVTKPGSQRRGKRAAPGVAAP